MQNSSMTGLLFKHFFWYFRLEALRKKSSIGHGRDYLVNKIESFDIESGAELCKNQDAGKSTPLKDGSSWRESIQQKDASDGDLQDDISSSPQENIVGLSFLPTQLHRKALRKGFEFVLLVVGETGLGKSTFINSLFLTDIYSGKLDQTKEIGRQEVRLEEGKVKLSLTVVDTPGYGDAMDNTDCCDPIVEYVEKQFDKFLEAETRVNREPLPDSRVNACLYFIAPTGHGLKKMDVECMKKLHKKVNIIPVIGKADACTREELELFKHKIRKQLSELNISVYKFPRTEEEPESAEVSMPFAVVGSNMVLEDENGKSFRGRRYPWGCVNMEDEVRETFQIKRQYSGKVPQGKAPNSNGF